LAGADVSECAELLGRKHRPPSLQKFLLVLAKDIGDFESRRNHRCLGLSRMTPGLAWTQYAIPTANSELQGIASGPDGNMWFTESIGNNIAKLVLSSVPTPNVLTISPLSLSFTGEQGGVAPAPQSLSIRACGLAVCPDSDR
jgi:hypothetical protein